MAITISRAVLEESDILHRLNDFPGWRLENNTLVREFDFLNFHQAFSLITSVALVSERLNHHAEIHNVYNRVKLTLFTHDAHGITEVDFAWIKLLSKSCLD